MHVREITCRSIIVPSQLPSSDYTVNPYTGCSHACIYCYARFMTRFGGHIGEEWGEFVDAKINAPDVFPRFPAKFCGKTCFMSSVTDPYLPEENTFLLTRRILEKLVSFDMHLHIQTKSGLIVRDIDILKRFRLCEAGITITTLDDTIRKEIEPRAGSVASRLYALRALKSAGISTTVFIGPILPGFTDWRAIIQETHAYTDMYLFENLNIAGSIRDTIFSWITQKHPNHLTLYTDIFTHTHGAYWQKCEREIREYCDTMGIQGRIYFHHIRK